MVRLLKKIIRKHSFTYTFEHRNRALVIYTFFAEYKRAFDKDHALKGNKLVLSRIPVQVNQFLFILIYRFVSVQNGNRLKRNIKFVFESFSGVKSYINVLIYLI